MKITRNSYPKTYASKVRTSIISSHDSERLVQRSVVRFDHPYSIELPDGSYKVVHDSYSVLVNIKSNKRSGNVVFAGDMTLMNDRWGRFNYTSVMAIFEYTPSVPCSVALDFETVERTGGAIDRIIEVMRYVKAILYYKNLPEPISFPTPSNILIPVESNYPVLQQLLMGI